MHINWILNGHSLSCRDMVMKGRMNFENCSCIGVNKGERLFGCGFFLLFSQIFFFFFTLKECSCAVPAALLWISSGWLLHKLSFFFLTKGLNIWQQQTWGNGNNIIFSCECSYRIYTVFILLLFFHCTALTHWYHLLKTFFCRCWFCSETEQLTYSVLDHSEDRKRYIHEELLLERVFSSYWV